MSDELLALITTYAIRIGGVIVLFLVAWFIAGRVRVLVQRGLGKANFDPTLGAFFANASRWIVLLLAILASLGVFGIETTSFAAVLGAAGLAIGLAFQGSLSNVASGTMLLIFRPFKVDDVIKVAGEWGKVTEIGLFTTAIDTVDNRRIILPNSVVFGSTIENMTFHEKRRVDISVGTEYSADLREVRKVLEASVEEIEGRLEEPGAQIFLVSLGDSSINWQVRVWCKTEDYFDVHERTILAVKTSLDDANIGIPFPQMDVHLDKLAA